MPRHRADRLGPGPRETAGAAKEEDGWIPIASMARFLVVLKPKSPLDTTALIAGLDPMLDELGAEVDHRTPAHLSAMLSGSENLRLQLFADVQSKLEGRVLEVVLMSREAMGRGAPLTRERFERLVDLASDTMPHLSPVFRSDRDGPMPFGV